MGLRERKREQTQLALADAALALFAERGYDATTIADIAERAGVSPRTFFAHHPSKEHVLFCGDDEQLADLGSAITGRPAGQDTLAALRDWIVAQLEGWNLEEVATREGLRRRVIDATPVLHAHERQLMARFEVVLRAAVAVDLGETPDDMRPRLVAATAAAALESTRPPEGVSYSTDEVLARIDAALAFLRGGLDALSDG